MNGDKRRLILKKKLHLNLNVRADDNIKPKKKVQGEKVVGEADVDEVLQIEIAEKENMCIAATDTPRNVVFNYGDEQQLQKTTMSLLKSSPTALAKFNRIIDTTVPTTNVYQQQKQTATLALAYRNIVSTDSLTTAAEATVATSETITTLTLKTEMQNDAELESADDNNLYQFINDNNNKMKRNDVHYLLKQLNSFSDIEEIEIVDNMQQQKKRQRQQQQQQQHIDLEEKYSPTTQSLVLVSPSALSHKGIRRYASLHQQETQDVREREFVATSLSHTTMAAGGVVGVPQFDDYLFQSCHYLETNYFAANYRTAMVESCSHEFRPSTTTTGTTSAAYSSHSSLHTFDIHETEPPSVICKAPSSQAPPPPEKLKQKQVANETEFYEVDNDDDELEYKKQQQIHSYATHAQQPPALGPPPRRFQMQARLTSSGVQTELTASSLSTAATNASLAKSSTLSQHTTSTSSSEAAARCRRKPFFKCCYTPIDRWRERRQQQQQKRPTETHSCSSDAASKKKDKEKEVAAGSAV